MSAKSLLALPLPIFFVLAPIVSSFAEETSVESLARDFRLRAYQVYRHDRARYNEARKLGDELLDAWRAAGRHEIAEVSNWFANAEKVVASKGELEAPPVALVKSMKKKKETPVSAPIFSTPKSSSSETSSSSSNEVSPLNDQGNETTEQLTPDAKTESGSENADASTNDTKGYESEETGNDSEVKQDETTRSEAGEAKNELDAPESESPAISEEGTVNEARATRAAVRAIWKSLVSN